MPRLLKIMIGFIVVVVVGGAITGHLQQGFGYPWPYPKWHHGTTVHWVWDSDVCWAEGQELCEEHCDDNDHNSYKFEEPLLQEDPEDGDQVYGGCSCM